MEFSRPEYWSGIESSHNAGDLGLIPGLEDPRRRERLPTLVFWPGEFHGLYNPWGCKELDMTEQLSLHFTMDQEGFPCTSVVKNLPANAGARALSLVRELDPARCN